MRLIRVCGTCLRLNPLFLAMLLVYWFLGLLGQALIIFTVVFLHEMGHVVVAAGYGIRIKEVELLPFGGVARLEGSIELDPVTETCVSLAGPLTNGFLALVGYIIYYWGLGNREGLFCFIQYNLMLGLFNLVPAVPLDGGRIFRALVSLRIGVKKATDKALSLSVLLGVLMAAVGIGSVFKDGGREFNFLVIAIFLIYSAYKEKGSAMYLFMKFLSRKKEELFREGVLLARQVVALESSHLKEVVKYFVPRKYHLVVVLGKDQAVKGTLTEGEIIEGIMGNGPETPVGRLVQRKK